MILRTPPQKKRLALDPSSPVSDRRVVVYNDTAPISSLDPSEQMVCTYHCRQMVIPLLSFSFFDLFLIFFAHRFLPLSCPLHVFIWGILRSGTRLGFEIVFFLPQFTPLCEIQVCIVFELDFVFP